MMTVQSPMPKRLQVAVSDGRKNHLAIVLLYEKMFLRGCENSLSCQHALCAPSTHNLC